MYNTYIGYICSYTYTFPVVPTLKQRFLTYSMRHSNANVLTNGKAYKHTVVLPWVRM